jgi:dipeptidyl-peptidase-4
MKVFSRLSICLIFLFAGMFPGYAQKKQITVADLYKDYTFLAQDVPGFASMEDGRYYSEIDASGNLVKKSFASGLTAAILIRADEIHTSDGMPVSLEKYSLSPDESKVLIKTDVRQIYRYSSITTAYVFDLETRKLTQVSAQPVESPVFSPDGKKIAFVQHNDLFCLDLTTGKITQITSDGEKNHIINGKCDWVYEEEFGFTTAFQWSPDGKQLAYYRFDESRVPVYTIPIYNSNQVYPSLYTYKYPKAGEPNSQVSVRVFDFATESTQSMKLGENTDQYIPRIKWTSSSNELCVYRMNRLQNKLELLLCNSETGGAHVLYTDTAKWYIEETLFDDLFFLKDGQHFIIMNEDDGWQHLYLYDLEGKKIRKLTEGQWDVDKVAGIDEKNDKIYYTAARPSPMERQLYSVDFRGHNTKEITHEPGWHSIQFNADHTFFLDNYSTINTPPVYTVRDAEGKAVRRLEDNHSLQARMAQYVLSKAKFMQVPASDSTALNAWMLLPPDFDSTKKYPVLFMNYGGPGSQSVIDQWGTVDFWQQLLAERGYIIVCVDNTGTGFRGAAFKKEKTYLQLGWTEIHDQMHVASWLGRHLSYVDASRIGHWGWSFGGLLSALAITVGSDVFHMAISVAPVTDWRYYDDIYTERFMRTPAENPRGYKLTSPIQYADRMKGKYLLIHGTADDNVHFQNSIMFSEALIQADKNFQQAYYPNKNHGIYGGETRFQLYTRMTDFILNNL